MSGEDGSGGKTEGMTAARVRASRGGRATEIDQRAAVILGREWSDPAGGLVHIEGRQDGSGGSG